METTIYSTALRPLAQLLISHLTCAIIILQHPIKMVTILEWSRKEYEITFAAQCTMCAFNFNQVIGHPDQATTRVPSSGSHSFGGRLGIRFKQTGPSHLPISSIKRGLGRYDLLDPSNLNPRALQWITLCDLWAPHHVLPSSSSAAVVRPGSLKAPTLRDELRLCVCAVYAKSPLLHPPPVSNNRGSRRSDRGEGDIDS